MNRFALHLANRFLRMRAALRRALCKRRSYRCENRRLARDQRRRFFFLLVPTTATLLKLLDLIFLCIAFRVFVLCVRACFDVEHAGHVCIALRVALRVALRIALQIALQIALRVDLRTA